MTSNPFCLILVALRSRCSMTKTKSNPNLICSRLAWAWHSSATACFTLFLNNIFGKNFNFLVFFGRGSSLWWLISNFFLLILLKNINCFHKIFTHDPEIAHAISKYYKLMLTPCIGSMCGDKMPVPRSNFGGPQKSMLNDNNKEQSKSNLQQACLSLAQLSHSLLPSSTPTSTNLNLN